MTQAGKVESLSEAIGGAVRAARRGARPAMTQEQLAERLREGGLDWSRNVIANLESGRMARIDIGDLFIVAAVLEVSPLDLVVPIDPVTGSSERELLEALPGFEYSRAALRLWLRGAGHSLPHLQNSYSGRAEESLARQLAEEAFTNGSYLLDLREDLKALPASDTQLRDGATQTRDALCQAIEDSLTRTQELWHRLQAIDTHGSHGDS